MGMDERPRVMDRQNSTIVCIGTESATGVGMWDPLDNTWQASTMITAKITARALKGILSLLWPPYNQLLSKENLSTPFA